MALCFESVSPAGFPAGARLVHFVACAKMLVSSSATTDRLIAHGDSRTAKCQAKC